MPTLAVGGPLDGQVLDETSLAVWTLKPDKPMYFRTKIRNGSRTQWLYLHKSILRKPPHPEVVIRKFVIPPNCGISTDYDLEVIAHHWWLMGDIVRYEYTRFL